MARNKSKPGWWRRGDLKPRLLCLGALLGVAGAVVYFLSLGWGKPWEVSQLAWGLFALAFIALITALLGLLVAGIVNFFQRLLSESLSRPRRAVFTGTIAMISAALATFALFSALPLALNADRWTTAGVTGVLVGAAFTMLSYWHTTEILEAT